MPYRRIIDCPKCGDGPLNTLETRLVETESVHRRRRKECDVCGYRCTTHEIIVTGDFDVDAARKKAVTRFLDDVRASSERHLLGLHNLTGVEQ